MGRALEFGHHEIRCLGQQRPGLPNTFAVYRSGALLHQGAFKPCLSLVERELGLPLPAPRLISTAAAAADRHAHLGVDQRPAAPPLPRVIRGHREKYRSH